MADDKKLTPGQQEMIASLTEEEKKQIAALLTPEGKIDEEKLQSVSGGLSPKLKAIIGLAAGGAVTLAGIGLALGLDLHYHPSGQKGAPPEGTVSQPSGEHTPAPAQPPLFEDDSHTPQNPEGIVNSTRKTPGYLFTDPSYFKPT